MGENIAEVYNEVQFLEENRMNTGDPLVPGAWILYHYISVITVFALPLTAPDGGEVTMNV
uniref:Uncharacterized protein n=1 Tax=Oryza brachyantha TaxID=4533 RepID=J3L9N1_ORYBR